MQRRTVLSALTAAVGASALPLVPETSRAAPAAKPGPAFTLCLNMSTIRGHKLGFARELETAAKAGFRSVEIWMDSLQAFVKTNAPADARRRAADLGLTLENAIGFAPWIVDDEAVRQQGLDQMKREMELLAQIGCKRVAAPAIGAHSPGSPKVDLYKAAERYRTLLELGDQTGVVPQLELWGFSANLNKLSEVLFVAVESGHPSARVLLDVYHLYKGGSSLDTLKLVGKPAMDIFHVNDYPAGLTPAAITDADRVYPGDGVAPIQSILKTIKDPTRPLVVSLEVFNAGYYAQDAAVVARTALARMQRMIAGV